MELDVIYYFSHIPSTLVFPTFPGIAVGFCPLCPAQVSPHLQSCPRVPAQAGAGIGEGVELDELS